MVSPAMDPQDEGDGGGWQVVGKGRKPQENCSEEKAGDGGRRSRRHRKRRGSAGDVERSNKGDGDGDGDGDGERVEGKSRKRRGRKSGAEDSRKVAKQTPDARSGPSGSGEEATLGGGGASVGEGHDTEKDEAARAMEVWEKADGSMAAAVLSISRAMVKLPEGQDFHYYNLFSSFKEPIDKASEMARRLLKRFGRDDWTDDVEDLGDWLAGVQDNLLEQVDTAMDQHKGRGPTDLATRGNKMKGDVGSERDRDEGGKQGGREERLLGWCRSGGRPGGEEKKVVRSRVQMHIDWIPRPQDKFDEPLDNSNNPFRPRPWWLKHISKAASSLPLSPPPPPPSFLSSPSAVLSKGADVASAVGVVNGSSKAARAGSAFDLHACRLGVAGGSARGTGPTHHHAHPLQDQLQNLTYQDWQLKPQTPQPPLPFDDATCNVVDTLFELRMVAKKLSEHKEIAVDLEHHSHRSFQGITCLMQISTRVEDFIIDTIALRSYIGPVLGPVFLNPSILKVMHGSDHDVLWLQRDFGIYILNLFDTGQASRVLKMPSAALKYLLSHFCGMEVDKRYQLADWRIRPIPSEMLKYAQSDTHFLLYIYDRLKELLLESRPPPVTTEAAEDGSVPKRDDGDGMQPIDLLQEVLGRSREICLTQCVKEVFTETSYLKFYRKLRCHLRPESLAVLAGLYAWRDRVARKEDESVGYVLPNHLLLRMAQRMPRDVRALTTMLHGACSLVAKNAAEVIEVIRTSKEQAADFAEAKKKLLANLEEEKGMEGEKHSVDAEGEEEEEEPLDPEFVMPTWMESDGERDGDSEGETENPQDGNSKGLTQVEPNEEELIGYSSERLRDQEGTAAKMTSVYGAHSLQPGVSEGMEVGPLRTEEERQGSGAAETGVMGEVKVANTVDETASCRSHGIESSVVTICKGEMADDRLRAPGAQAVAAQGQRNPDMEEGKMDADLTCESCPDAVVLDVQVSKAKETIVPASVSLSVHGHRSLSSADNPCKEPPVKGTKNISTKVIAVKRGGLLGSMLGTVARKAAPSRIAASSSDAQPHVPVAVESSSGSLFRTETSPASTLEEEKQVDLANRVHEEAHGDAGDCSEASKIVAMRADGSEHGRGTVNTTGNGQPEEMGMQATLGNDDMAAKTLCSEETTTLPVERLCGDDRAIGQNTCSEPKSTEMRQETPTSTINEDRPSMMTTSHDGGSSLIIQPAEKTTTVRNEGRAAISTKVSVMRRGGMMGSMLGMSSRNPGHKGANSFQPNPPAQAASVRASISAEDAAPAEAREDASMASEIRELKMQETPSIETPRSFDAAAELTETGKKEGRSEEGGLTMTGKKEVEESADPDDEVIVTAPDVLLFESASDAEEPGKGDGDEDEEVGALVADGSAVDGMDVLRHRLGPDGLPLPISQVFSLQKKRKKMLEMDEAGGGGRGSAKNLRSQANEGDDGCGRLDRGTDDGNVVEGASDGSSKAHKGSCGKGATGEARVVEITPFDFKSAKAGMNLSVLQKQQPQQQQSTAEFMNDFKQKQKKWSRDNPPQQETKGGNDKWFFDPNRAATKERGMKAGKRSQVFPQSGNRSATYRD